MEMTLDAGSGFIDYQWYNNGSMMINTTQTLIVSNAGNYHVDNISYRMYSYI